MSEVKYSKSTIMEMFKEFLEKEYEETLRTLEHRKDLEMTKREVVNQGMARCCGVAFFMQNFVDFEEVDKVYQEYWSKFWDLMTN